MNDMTRRKTMLKVMLNMLIIRARCAARSPWPDWSMSTARYAPIKPAMAPLAPTVMAPLLKMAEKTLPMMPAPKYSSSHRRVPISYSIMVPRRREADRLPIK